MTQLRALHRGIAGLWLALFAFAGLGMPVIDALVVHSTDVAAHWEDADDRSCPPRHDASVCQLFQAHQSARASQGESLAANPETEYHARRPEALRRLQAQAGLIGGPTSRGPPLG